MDKVNTMVLDDLVRINDNDDDDDDDDDDDSVYTNAAARLRELKAMKPPTPDPVPEIVVMETPEVYPEIVENNVSETINLYDSPLSSPAPIRSRQRGIGARSARTRKNKENEPLVTIDLESPSSSLISIHLDDEKNRDDILEVIDCDVDTSLPSEDSYKMDVKVRWRSREIERIKLGMNEKFAKIFEYFSQKENVPDNQILLTRRDVPIHHSDTPASINLQIIEILEGGVVDSSYKMAIVNDEPLCKIKIQSSSSTRHFLTFETFKTQTFEKLFEFCSIEKKVELSRIKLYFDGEGVNPSDTPESLDLDDEACFDLKIV